MDGLGRSVWLGGATIEVTDSKANMTTLAIFSCSEARAPHPPLCTLIRWTQTREGNMRPERVYHFNYGRFSRFFTNRNGPERWWWAAAAYHRASSYHHPRVHRYHRTRSDTTYLRPYETQCRQRAAASAELIMTTNTTMAAS